jgi:hypothetical protein
MSLRALVQGRYFVSTRRAFPTLALREVLNELRRPHHLSADRIKIVYEGYEFLQEHPVLSDHSAMLVGQLSL